jgi:hypothetical protein
MNIRYFFIKDQVEAREVHIEHCPTEKMLANYFTKPLQGMLFKHMQDYIMNIDPHNKYYSGHRSVLSNHVDVSSNDIMTAGKEQAQKDPKMHDDEVLVHRAKK